MSDDLIRIIANKDNHIFNLQNRLEKSLIEVNGLKAFYNYFAELYGEGLEIANWHQNGDLEPFDNFFESAESEKTEGETK